MMAAHVEARVLEAAEEPPSAITAQVPLRRRDILRSTRELRELAAALRAATFPLPRGPAMVRQLLTAPDSPIYRRSPPGDLWAAACRAHEALERR